MTAPPPAWGATRFSWDRPQQIVANGFDAVSCPSTTECIAVPEIDSRTLVTSSNPAGGAGAWEVTQLPAPVDTGEGGVAVLSCPTVSFCAAIGDDGNVLVSSKPLGGAHAWTTSQVDAYPLTSIACPSSRLCVAVDDAGDVATSTDPAGQPSSWTVTDVDNTVGPQCGKYVPGVGCRLGLSAISCPTLSLCVAIDPEGNVVTSSDPTGGAAFWHLKNIEPAGSDSPALGIICPTLSWCIAAVGGSTLFVSHDPADHDSTWQPVSTGLFLQDTACPATTLCVANADPGPRTAYSYDPTAGPESWHTGTIDPAAGITDASCPVRSLCVAVDSGGNVVVGTPTPTRREIAKRLRVAENALQAGLVNLRTVERDGYHFRFDAPSAGRLTVTWRLQPTIHPSQRSSGERTIATLVRTYGEPGQSVLTLRLTKHGRDLITGPATIVATARFTAATGGPSVSISS
jgi:hypothetical protein